MVMANVIHAIKEYEKSLTYYKEQEFIQCFEEMAEDAESNPDAEIRMVDEFNIRSLLYYFPIRDDAPEINKDTEAAAVYVTEQLNALCKDNEKSGFCHGCVATSVKDLKIFFEFIHDFYPMEMSLYRVLTETLSNDETVTGMIGITHEGETVDEFLMGLYDNSDITTLDKLNTVLHKCGCKLTAELMLYLPKRSRRRSWAAAYSACSSSVSGTKVGTGVGRSWSSRATKTR